MGYLNRKSQNHTPKNEKQPIIVGIFIGDLQKQRLFRYSLRRYIFIRYHPDFSCLHTLQYYFVRLPGDRRGKALQGH